MTRQRLPNRRGHELLTFEHDGIRYTAGVGRFADGGLAEVFLNTAKHGTALDVNVRDVAVAASLLLQHGCPIDTLRQALTRNGDGSGSARTRARSPVGVTVICRAHRPHFGSGT